MKHYHVQAPFLCVKATMMGWAVSSECRAEIVELCSEMVLGDTVFLEDMSALLLELERRGAALEALEEFRESTFGSQVQAV